MRRHHRRRARRGAAAGVLRDDPFVIVIADGNQRSVRRNAGGETDHCVLRRTARGVFAVRLGEDQIDEHRDIVGIVDPVFVHIDACAVVRGNRNTEEASHESGDVESVQNTVAVDVTGALTGLLNAVAAHVERAVRILDDVANTGESRRAGTFAERRHAREELDVTLLGAAAVTLSDGEAAIGLHANAARFAVLARDRAGERLACLPVRRRLAERRIIHAFAAILRSIGRGKNSLNANLARRTPADALGHRGAREQFRVALIRAAALTVRHVRNAVEADENALRLALLSRDRTDGRRTGGAVREGYTSRRCRVAFALEASSGRI